MKLKQRIKEQTTPGVRGGKIQKQVCRGHQELILEEWVLDLPPEKDFDRPEIFLRSKCSRTAANLRQRLWNCGRKRVSEEGKIFRGL